MDKVKVEQRKPTLASALSKVEQLAASLWPDTDKVKVPIRFGDIRAIKEEIDRLAAFEQSLRPPPAADVVETVARAIHEHLSRRNVMQYLDNPEDCEGIARSVVAALTPTPAQDIEKLVEVVEEYATEQDEDAWCMRVKHGSCSSRKCNVEGGWTPGNPADYSLATCARYRLHQALAAHRNTGEG